MNSAAHMSPTHARDGCIFHISYASFHTIKTMLHLLEKCTDIFIFKKGQDIVYCRMFGYSGFFFGRFKKTQAQKNSRFLKKLKQFSEKLKDKPIFRLDLNLSKGINPNVFARIID